MPAGFVPALNVSDALVAPAMGTAPLYHCRPYEPAGMEAVAVKVVLAAVQYPRFPAILREGVGFIVKIKLDCEARQAPAPSGSLVVRKIVTLPAVISAADGL